MRTVLDERKCRAYRELLLLSTYTMMSHESELFEYKALYHPTKGINFSKYQQMKISSIVAIFVCNLATAMSPHQRFESALDKSIKLNRSPFKYNNPSGLVLHGHKERPRISKILKFQMDHILRDYEQHLSQGNMNRSHRRQFKNKLRSKFQNIQAYSKDRLRKEQDEKSRRRRSRYIEISRRG